MPQIHRAARSNPIAAWSFAIAACLLAPSVFAQTLNVAPGGSNAGNCQPGPCQTIAYALIQAPAGATINIAAGTYSESPRITRSVTLNGAAAASTIVAPLLANQLPAPAPINSGSVIIDINGAGINVVVRNLTVRFPSNNYPGVANAPVRGIWVTGGANARIENNIVTEIHDATISGAQTGDCIRAGDPTRGGSGTFEVLNNQLSRCQKTGVTANQTGTLATITGNTIIDGGTGERNGTTPRPLGQTVLASNGIQMAFGARGTITNNIIRNMQCNLPSPQCGGNIDVDISTATGILVLGQGVNTVVSGNTITASDDGMSVGPNLFGVGAPNPLAVTGNTLTDNRFRGFTVFSGTTTFRGNTVTGGTVGLLAANFGETISATALLNDPSATVVGSNILRGASVNGIWVRTFPPAPIAEFGGPPISPSVDGPLPRAPLSPDGSSRPLVQGSSNQFVNNLVAGADNDPNEGVANLTCNWWGSVTGPGTNGANPATANVTRTPWAVNNIDFACPPGGPVGNFTITKAGPATATAGQGINYTITITNNGPADGAGSVFTDTVPASISNVTWNCTASSGAACPNANGTGNVINQTIALFPPGGRLNYAVSGTIALGTTQILNTATITPLTGVGGSASSSTVITFVNNIVVAVDALGTISTWVLLLGALLIGFTVLRRRT